VPSAVAGNVGIPASSLVGSVGPRATVVCEASSFQLEDTLEFAPEAAVLLNLAGDHLDRHATMEAYTAAKLRIFARQRTHDIAVLPAGFPSADARPKAGGAQGLRARRVRFGTGPGSTLQARGGELRWEGRPLLSLSELPLRGQHNVENAMAAAAVCLARGIDREAVERSCAAVYLIGEDAPAIAEALRGADTRLRVCGELERAVGEAARAAGPGGVVLLSPACASFDQFADFEARGDHFRELVPTL
jgi:UDP-N-acetylmuramoylalanine--D-glutamate ligase